MKTQPLAAVIIPAHNEEAVIARLLRQVTASMEPGEFEIIVAANGCTDRTVESARGAAPGITVLDLPASSKVAALNAGDAAATVFPRLYVDADVMVSTETLRELARVLADPAAPCPTAPDDSAPLAAAPALRTDLSGASWFVRAHYRIWELSDYRTRGHIGSGIYALSRAGRQRFDRFPDLIADDRYVQQLFSESERLTLPGHTFTVHSPKTMRALLHRATRAAAGNLQLRTGGRGQLHSEPAAPSSQRNLLRKVLPQPALWPAFAVYCTAYAVPRLLAVRKIRSGRSHVWERDETSRQWQ
jgi:glycosyltransferase involved in cell wall biosynthesis